mmetsp:Transcript_12905/g.51946  ORF Transcript_12905/g.51946 Transcript_12905/m.51946 type:complete len:202 (+) Transcript_12905:2316-2921(+)
MPVLWKLAPSSTVNSMPPMGAPNATATPTAVPIATKSRLSASFRKCDGFLVRKPSVWLPNALSPPPTRPPPWTNGPSFPAINPAPMLNAMPPSFAARVLILSRPLRCTPLRYVFSSGMPDPAARGSTWDTSPPATAARRQEMMTQTSHAPNPAPPGEMDDVVAPYFHPLNFLMSPSTVKARKPMTTPMSTLMAHLHCSSAL